MAFFCTLWYWSTGFPGLPSNLQWFWWEEIKVCHARDLHEHFFISYTTLQFNFWWESRAQSVWPIYPFSAPFFEIKLSYRWIAHSRVCVFGYCVTFGKSKRKIFCNQLAFNLITLLINCLYTIGYQTQTLKISVWHCWNESYKWKRPNSQFFIWSKEKKILSVSRLALMNE